MQKVEGSSPFIRFSESPAQRLLHKTSERGFSIVRAEVDGSAGFRIGSARSASASSAGERFRDLLCYLSEAGAPEFEQVVGGCDQLPLGLAGGEAAAEEAVGAPDAFRVREDRFDDLLTSAVERSTFRRRQ